MARTEADGGARLREVIRLGGEGRSDGVDAFEMVGGWICGGAFGDWNGVGLDGISSRDSLHKSA